MASTYRQFYTEEIHVTRNVIRSSTVALGLATLGVLSGCSESPDSGPRLEHVSQAATTGLQPGDVAVTCFNSNTDALQIVTLVDLEAGTDLRFTDREWTGTGFNTGESVDVSVSGATPLPATAAGQEIPFNPGGIGNPDEQVFIYQGSVATSSFTLLWGLQTLGNPPTVDGSVDGSWPEASSLGSNVSALPPTLTSDNVLLTSPPAPATDTFAAYVGIMTGTKDQLRAALSNRNNWSVAGTAATAPACPGPLHVIAATDGGGTDAPAGTGGATGTGGDTGTGGVTGTGGAGTGGIVGTDGGTGTGGIVGTGGVTGTGGVVATGTGGTPGTGGVTGTGGAVIVTGTGGAVAIGTGGATTSDASVGTGGATTTDGSVGTGGATTDGSIGSGGATGTDGAAPTDGSVGTGTGGVTGTGGTTGTDGGATGTGGKDGGATGIGGKDGGAADAKGSDGGIDSGPSTSSGSGCGCSTGGSGGGSMAGAGMLGLGALLMGTRRRRRS
jgi:MYXO-CTERM domain-containing protein